MNSRLTVAAHILGLLAAREQMSTCAATSEQLAASVGTNPVVVRRVLSQLKAAGLVDSKRGVGGGTVLARDPAEITLRMVYEAVDAPDCAMIGRHAASVGTQCAVAPIIADYLDELYADAEEALRRRLELVTVAQMAKSVMDRVKRMHPMPPTDALPDSSAVSGAIASGASSIVASSVLPPLGRLSQRH